MYKKGIDLLFMKQGTINFYYFFFAEKFLKKGEQSFSCIETNLHFCRNIVKYGIFLQYLKHNDFAV